MESQYKYLTLVHFYQCRQWDVKRFINKRASFANGVYLKDILTPIKIPFDKNDIRTKGYRVVKKINFFGELYLRDLNESESVKGKLFEVPGGSLVFSKINVKHGCIYFHQIGLPLFGVSSEYPVYLLNESRVNGKFLSLLLRTDYFKNILKAQDTGIGKSRTKASDFLEIEVPLPSILEQNERVHKYAYLNHIADQHENTAKEKEQLCLQYWVDRLGIDISSKEKIAAQGLSFTNLKSLSQWGVDFIVKKAKQDRFSMFFKCCKIKDICKIGSGGTPSRGRKEYYCGTIPWIKTGELRNNIIYDTEEKITKEAVLNSSAKLYPQGCLVMAMYGATIGKTAKLGIDATTNQACAVLYDIDTSLVNLDYLWYYLRTQTNKFKELAYGGAQPNINAGIVSDYLLPLPPLAVQEEMVRYTKQVLKDIDTLKKETLLYRNQSLEIVNQVLFDVSCSE